VLRGSPRLRTIDPDAETSSSLRAFIGALQGIGDRDWSRQITHLRDILSSAAAGLGVRWFTYHIVQSPSLSPTATLLPYTITTCPDAWTRRYASEGYARDDPVLTEALRSTLPFMWSRVAASKEIGPRQRRFFEEARAAGLRECLTLPIHVQSEVAALSVVPHELHRDRVLHHRHLLYLMAHYYHLKARRPLLEATLTASSRRRSLLSPRETQVLGWSAKGKSTSEISTLLAISQKSVEFHVEGAKRKLNVSNRTHAVAKAIMLGLLPVD
jgi:LuxR family transcriptional regulator, activator of conjugal transfer of Ti plasmids